MNRPRLIILAVSLAILFLLLPDKRSEALDGLSVLGQVELQKIFADLATSRTSLPKADIEITHFTATPESIELPPGELDFRTISVSQGKELGKKTVVADVLVNGVTQERVTLSGDLTLHGDVICAARAIPRHTIIVASDLVRVRRDLTMLGPDLITDEAAVLDKETKTTLQPGAVLYGHFLKDPQLVKRGDIVSILAATDHITVTVPGRVQASGAKGDLIKVKNLMSRREIYAKVIGPDTVQAQF